MDYNKETVFLDKISSNIKKINKKIQYSEDINLTRISKSEVNSIITQINNNITNLITKMDTIMIEKKKNKKN